MNIGLINILFYSKKNLLICVLKELLPVFTSFHTMMYEMEMLFNICSKCFPLKFGDECLFLPMHKYVKFNIPVLFCFS